MNETQKAEFLKSLPTLDEAYILLSHLTHVPYTVYNEESGEDEAFLFTNLETAKAKAIELAEAHIQPTIAVKMNQKEMIMMVSGFFAYGITAMHWTTDEGEAVYKVREVIKRPDFSHLPEQQRPLENPSLQISMIYYMQELRRKDPKTDLKQLQDLDEEMSANIKRAKYLLPLVDKSEGDNKNIQQVLFRINESTSLVPLFSDGMEYQRFKGDKEEVKAIVVTFEQLATMEIPNGTNGYIINPGGVGVTLTKDYIQRIHETFE